MFKRVAVVEKFFDIIYSVHVESSSEDTPHLRGRAGKHCGQKRTYRAVSPDMVFIFPFKDGFKVRACEVCSMLSVRGTGKRIYGPEEKVL